ncbi:MAG: hypothetical protein ACKOPM_16655 [Novosphingobium sp.]
MTEHTTLKAIWIEPELHSLDVEQTNAQPNRGSDGDFFPDCTRS